MPLGLQLKRFQQIISIFLFFIFGSLPLFLKILNSFANLHSSQAWTLNWQQSFLFYGLIVHIDCAELLLE